MLLLLIYYYHDYDDGNSLIRSNSLISIYKTQKNTWCVNAYASKLLLECGEQNRNGSWHLMTLAFKIFQTDSKLCVTWHRTPRSVRRGGKKQKELTDEQKQEIKEVKSIVGSCWLYRGWSCEGVILYIFSCSKIGLFLLGILKGQEYCRASVTVQKPGSSDRNYPLTERCEKESTF